VPNSLAPITQYTFYPPGDEDLSARILLLNGRIFWSRFVCIGAAVIAILIAIISIFRSSPSWFLGGWLILLCTAGVMIYIGSQSNKVAELKLDLASTIDIQCIREANQWGGLNPRALLLVSAHWESDILVLFLTSPGRPPCELRDVRVLKPHERLVFHASKPGAPTTLWFSDAWYEQADPQKGKPTAQANICFTGAIIVTTPDPAVIMAGAPAQSRIQPQLFVSAPADEPASDTPAD
jgi:hypothetical protein